MNKDPLDVLRFVSEKFSHFVAEQAEAKAARELERVLNPLYQKFNELGLAHLQVDVNGAEFPVWEILDSVKTAAKAKLRSDLISIITQDFLHAAMERIRSKP